MTGLHYKIHLRSGIKPNATLCNRPVFWNVKITKDDDLVTCVTCRGKIQSKVEAFKAVEFGKGIEIAEAECDTLTRKIAALKTYAVRLEAQLEDAHHHISKALNVPDHDAMVRAVQNTLIPYWCKYKSNN